MDKHNIKKGDKLQVRIGERKHVNIEEGRKQKQI
jgi:hypothetical protein